MCVIGGVVRGENAGNTFLDGSDLAYLQLLCDSFARHIFNNSPLSLLSCSRSSTSHRAFLTHTQPHTRPTQAQRKPALDDFYSSAPPAVTTLAFRLTRCDHAHFVRSCIYECDHSLFQFQSRPPRSSVSRLSLSLSWDARCLCLPRLRRTLPVSHAPRGPRLATHQKCTPFIKNIILIYNI